VTAAHKLPANWLVRDQDLKGDATAKKPFLDLYAASEIADGKTVELSAFTHTPNITLTPGKVLYRFPVDSQLASDLNAGSNIAIFRKGPASIPVAPVLAVECSGGCVAIVELSPAESELVRNLPAAELTAERCK
jgi:hypothetical protein